MKVFLTIIFITISSNLACQGSGLIIVNFEDNLKNNDNIDSIYGSDIKSNVIIYLSDRIKYPRSSFSNCEEGIVQVNIKLKDFNRVFAIDTNLITIIKGNYPVLNNEVIDVLKSLPKFGLPLNYWKDPSSFEEINFVLSFNFILLSCDDPIWRNDSFPENGYYIGYYKRENRKRVEGYFKNGRPDSLWVFYDTTGFVIKRGYCKYDIKYNCYSAIRGFKGEKIGTWEYFDDKGNLKSKEYYIRKKNKIIFEIWRFDTNGEIIYYRKSKNCKTKKEIKYIQDISNKQQNKTR